MPAAEALMKLHSSPLVKPMARAASPMTLTITSSIYSIQTVYQALAVFYVNFYFILMQLYCSCSLQMRTQRLKEVKRLRLCS
jgi:hypothetical protein